MPQLPAFNPLTNVNESPHVVILGAGASRAAFPNGDAKGSRLPLMVDLVDCLGLGQTLQAAGFQKTVDFEALYDELATTGLHRSLREEIEAKVWSYFERLQLPDAPTLYDYLLLSMRPKDCVATFNWDPFLANAFLRNREFAPLPKVLFLHGNVAIAVCIKDRVKGFSGDTCSKCGAPLQPTKLLYPVRRKNYKSDPFIFAEWKELEASLQQAYMLTIFGYAAPATDVEAVDLLMRGWGDNPTFELAQVNIVDIKPEEELRKTWQRFLCRTHYGTTADLRTTWLLRHPRRSCEALAMATLQNDPWRENPVPGFKSLAQFRAWIAPLLAEENKSTFTGNPCLQPQNFGGNAPEKSPTPGTDWVLGWLKAMCKGELIPPFCVELVLKDGSRYNLHSIVAFEDQTRTLCARIWDLRAFRPCELSQLKQSLNRIRTRRQLSPAEAVHPKLDWANLHLHYEDVAYCIEWHDRIWPEKNGPQKGRVTRTRSGQSRSKT
jgi:hypothetical protein